MTLKYRGLSYEEHISDVDSYQTDLSAKYRGFTYHIRRAVIYGKAPSQPHLKYRGANYSH